MATISLLVSMLLLFLISSTDGACTTTGNTQGNCGGRSYDLCSIVPPRKDLPDNVDQDKGASKYTFDVDLCNGVSSCATQSGFPAAAVCQFTIADRTKSFNCGTTNATVWNYDDSDTSNGFQFTVTFPNGHSEGTGDVRQTMFTFVDNGTEIDLTYLSEEKGADGIITYYFIVSASASSESPVGFIGLVLMLLAFFALVTYFIVGALIMYFYKGARGLEIIPNYMFWKDLPFLIKDGFMFIISPCYKRGSYEKI
jgi:hypothetical protein